MSFLVKLNRFISQLQLQVARQFEPYHPALAYNVIPVGTPRDSTPNHSDGQSILDNIMSSFLWAAVPKYRRSPRKRIMRRNGWNYVREYMMPKKNIVECLECGHYHERHTICGNCYEKVKAETEAMREAMGEDVRQYNQPKSEVVFVYENETVEDKNKYIVEMEKPRPEWFSKSLLTKAKTR